MKAATSLSSLATGAACAGAPNLRAGVAQGSASTSSGSTTSTGPGVPAWASASARATTSPAWSACASEPTHLATPPNMRA